MAGNTIFSTRYHYSENLCKLCANDSMPMSCLARQKVCRGWHKVSAVFPSTYIIVLALEVFDHEKMSRWQFESSCSLLQGKLLRRSSRNGSLLAEVSLPLKLSLDIEKTIINRISLTALSPSFSFTDGITFTTDMWY